MGIEIRFKRRAANGAAGAPTALRTAEPSYNMADGTIYVGFGDDGGGNATSIKRFAKDDFVVNVPAGGTAGQVLGKASGADGDVAWQTVSSGSAYTASGNGIELAAGQFSLNFAEIDTGLGLTAALAGKANTSHVHDASQITTGTLDIARIPVLPGNKTVVSSGGIANLTAGQQADIAEGTIVATTDGQRWVYSGTGSKTLEASYVSLADTTPQWSAIESKPAFAAVATSGAYSDLSGRPTLGTMASQNANAVAITGGSIDGVILDGGTF